MNAPDTSVPPGTYAGQLPADVIAEAIRKIRVSEIRSIEVAPESEATRGVIAECALAALAAAGWSVVPAGESAGELVRWLHGQAAEMKARSREDLSPEQCAALDEPPGFARRGPVVVLEGDRARQAQLASGLAMAIAHIVMRPEIPHA